MTRSSRKKKPITLGELLRAARKKRNRSAEDIAALCYVTKECVHQRERRYYVMDMLLPQIAQAYGIALKRLKTVNDNGRRLHQRKRGDKPYLVGGDGRRVDFRRAEVRRI
jgi:transcriptional regulator with XRE-family HTH domain